MAVLVVDFLEIIDIKAKQGDHISRCLLDKTIMNLGEQSSTVDRSGQEIMARCIEQIFLGYVLFGDVAEEQRHVIRTGIETDIEPHISERPETLEMRSLAGADGSVDRISDFSAPGLGE